MQVILLERVEKLGQMGDEVKVKDGFARNFLLPKGLAYPATEGNKKKITFEAARIARERSAEKDAAQAVADKLAQVQLTFAVKVGEEDKLYGSVTAADIQRRLSEAGHEVDKRQIDLPEPIRALGEFKVGVKVHAEIRPEVQVTVVKE